MKGYASYQDIKKCLQKKEEFEGNSMSAVVISNDGVKEYVVFSYSTIIARYSAKDGVWHNDIKYSRTTSRHQGLCRAWLTADDFPTVEIIKE